MYSGSCSKVTSVTVGKNEFMQLCNALCKSVRNIEQ